MTAALEGGEWSAARPGRTLPPGKTWYPFYKRLGGPQGQSELTAVRVYNFKLVNMLTILSHLSVPRPKFFKLPYFFFEGRGPVLILLFFSLSLDFPLLLHLLRFSTEHLQALFSFPMRTTCTAHYPDFIALNNLNYAVPCHIFTPHLTLLPSSYAQIYAVQNSPSCEREVGYQRRVSNP